MTGRGVLRLALFLVLTVAFVWSLLVIVVTGPIAVRTPSKLELPYELDISPERLRRDIERLCGELSPRDHEQAGNLDRTAEWIAAEFRAAGLAVELQEYETVLGRFTNVVGFRRGLAAGEPVRVFGAHYDTFEGSPGADDNASGVAVLLELVRTLPSAAPRRSQYFVAFGTAEPPFSTTEEMGSYVFARGLDDAGTGVDLMLSLDVVGYFSDTPASQRFPLFPLGWIYPDRGDFIAVSGDLGSGRWINRARGSFLSMTDLPVRTFRGPGVVLGTKGSDHSSFRRLGLPGLLITDTASLRNDAYHTADDTPEKLDYQRLAEVVRGIHGLVLDRDVAD